MAFWDTVVTSATGLVGVGLGAFIQQSISGRSALLASNADDIRDRRRFLTDTVSAADAQFLFIASVREARTVFIELVRNDLRERPVAGEPLPYLDESLQRRQRKANSAWREVLARRHVVAQPDLGHAMEAYDLARANVTARLGSPPRDDEAPLWDALDLALARVYREVALSNLQYHLIEANTLLPLLQRRKERARLVGEVKKLETSPLVPTPAPALDEPAAASEDLANVVLRSSAPTVVPDES